jgi:hypothetical protein
MREGVSDGERRMRSNVSEQSLAAVMLWDVERMLDDNHSHEDIVRSVKKRLEKYLRYEERLKISRARRMGCP